MEINETFVKLGRFPYSTVPIGSFLQVRVVGDTKVYHFECVKEERKNNQDGTMDVVSVLKWNPLME